MSIEEKFRIQLAEEKDASDILMIVKQAFIQYCKAIGIDTIEALMESAKDVLSDMDKKKVYIAYWDHVPVGSIRIEIKDKKAIISRFAIVPEYQSLGIGSKILSFVEQSLVPFHVKILELYSAVDNIRLKEFYLRNGFQVVSVDKTRGYQRGVFEKDMSKAE